ncbi:hypothetical protein EF405_17635 [Cyclobacteriaceae bacterium YHN15]|nr:hypothetical protein EF405_17635 [Cyclobacteriaceae bacterium YHN15]
MLLFYTSQNKEISVKLVLLINGEKGGLGTFQKFKFEKSTALKFSVLKSTKFKCELLYFLYKMIKENLSFVIGYILNIVAVGYLNH